MDSSLKNIQYVKFCTYGFLKNLRFFDAFFILFLLERGLPFTQIGVLYAVREIAINISEIPSGIIADTYGRKNALMASFIGYIFSFAIFYLAESFWFFLIAFLVYGISDAFRTGTHKGMIMDYLKLNRWQDQKINYYGHTRSWSQKGSAISALIAGLIVFYSGSYQSIFLYSIIPYFINFFLVLTYPSGLNHSSTKEDNKGRTGLVSNFKSLLVVIQKPNVFKIINTSALHTAYLRAVKDYIQPLIVNVALLIPIMVNIEAERKNGIIIGVIYFFIYLLTSQASRFASRAVAFRKENISYLTLLLGFIFGLLCGVFYVIDLWFLALFAFIGIYIMENLRKPILTGFISDHVSNDLLTSVISAQSQWRTIITAMLALAFGITADYVGIGMAFIGVTVILISSTMIIDRFKTNSSDKIR